MGVDDAANGGALRAATRFAGLLLSLPVTMGVTALGAGAIATRELWRLASSLWSPRQPEVPAPRHHAGRVREQIGVAVQTARKAGLLSKRDR